MNEKNIYMGQFESLLSYTKDDLTLINFFNGSKEDKKEWQVAVEFIYRCLKCEILISLNFSNFSDYTNGFITSYEDIARHISKYIPKDTLCNEISNPILRRLNDEIWYANIFTCSEEIDKLAKDCNLEAYEDYWEDDNDPRWLKFQYNIEEIFKKNNIAWGFNYPLFPVHCTRAL